MISIEQTGTVLEFETGHPQPLIYALLCRRYGDKSKTHFNNSVLIKLIFHFIYIVYCIIILICKK